MRNYIQIIAKYRKILIILLILINLIALVGVTRLNINAKFDIFKIDNSDYQKILTEMQETFGGQNQTILLVETRNDIEQSINDVVLILEDEDVNFTSPYKILNLLDSSNTEGTLDALGSLSPIKEFEGTTYITFTLDVNSDYDFDSLFIKFDNQHLTYYMSGDTYMQYEIVNLIMGVLLVIPPLALLLILLTFRSQLSSFKAAFLSVLPAGLSALWTVGLIGWIGGEISIITVLSPIFAIVIGSADGLHFVTHMEEELVHKNSHDALIHTLTIVGMPMIITTTTSIAGFIGLLLINTAAIQSLAIFASIGVFLAGCITWYVLPLIFTSNINLKHHNKGTSKHVLRLLWGKRSIVISVILIVVSLLFIPNIKTEFNQLMFFRDFTTVQRNFNKIVSVNDGAIPLYYYGESSIEEIPKRLELLETFLDTLEDHPYVKKVINPLGMIKTNQKLDLKMLSTAKDFIQIKDDKLYYRFMVFPIDLNNNSIQEIENMTLSYNEALNGQLIGAQFLMKEMNQSIVKGQIMSIVTAFVLISIMLMLTLKSLKLTIIASLPIVLTSIILYGFLGLTQISLNLMTCTIFSITLGIGVDYAIHYTSVYKYYSDIGEENPKVLAFKYSSRPVIANAIGLSLGLSALWLSPLLVHLHISSLMWVSMMVAVFMSLTLLPTLLPKTAKKTQ